MGGISRDYKTMSDQTKIFAANFDESYIEMKDKKGKAMPDYFIDNQFAMLDGGIYFLGKNVYKFDI